MLRADGGTWPRRRIRDEALTFLLAGHENTANAMSWFWYLMALHIEKRLRRYNRKLKTHRRHVEGDGAATADAA